ncbi:MAG: acetyl-CoA carboxylase carboxyltransferase subunit alpha [Lentisphaeria bacterium]|nr:acetyl-CoA carboxylase carboxyltransferase subunit alpha [Lentisphaeria bacterium]
MSIAVLEFEKPLAELEDRIDALMRMDAVGSGDHSKELRSLRRKLTEAKKSVYANLTPWQRVQLARHPYRPYSLDYISRICTDFMEFHGDRRFADDPAIVGGFARIDGVPVMMIGTQKGRNVKENVFRNFGCPNPEGYRKALRLMKVAELAGLPIVTLIDTPGAYPGVGAEERHIGEAIAVNLREMFGLKVPVISFVIGEGGSGGALGLGVANKVFLLENAYYSIITPEGCAAILWKDRAYSEQAAAALKLTADELLKLGLIDGVIQEPVGGAHHNYDKAAAYLKLEIVKQLEELSGMSPDELVEQRYRHFRDVKYFGEAEA